MDRINVFLFVIAAALLLSGLTGCASSRYYYGTHVNSYHRNSWDYDRYYRSRVNYNYHQRAVRRTTRPVNRARVINRSRAIRARHRQIRR